MSQIFHRHTNIYSRLSILGLVGFVAFLGWVVVTDLTGPATSPARA